jgi:hypothetical protein
MIQDGDTALMTIKNIDDAEKRSYHWSSKPDDLPNVGIAAGAGVMDAFDGRNPGAVSIGTGGLLQGANYLSSLWRFMNVQRSCIMSLAQADFPTVGDLILGPDKVSGWLTQFDIFDVSWNPSQEMQYIKTIWAFGERLAFSNFKLR